MAETTYTDLPNGTRVATVGDFEIRIFSDLAATFWTWQVFQGDELLEDGQENSLAACEEAAEMVIAPYSDVYFGKAVK